MDDIMSKSVGGVVAIAFLSGFFNTTTTNREVSDHERIKALQETIRDICGEDTSDLSVAENKIIKDCINKLEYPLSISETTIGQNQRKGDVDPYEVFEGYRDSDASWIPFGEERLDGAGNYEKANAFLIGIQTDTNIKEVVADKRRNAHLITTAINNVDDLRAQPRTYQAISPEFISVSFMQAGQPDDNYFINTVSGNVTRSNGITYDCNHPNMSDFEACQLKSNLKTVIDDIDFHAETLTVRVPEAPKLSTKSTGFKWPRIG